MHQESDPKSTEVSAKHLINYHIHGIKCQILYVEEHFRCSLVGNDTGLCPSTENFLPAKKKINIQIVTKSLAVQSAGLWRSG